MMLNFTSSETPKLRMTKYGPRTRSTGRPTSAAKPAARRPPPAIAIASGTCCQVTTTR